MFSKRKILISSLAAMIACTSVYADDDPYTQAQYSIGVSGIYSTVANAIPNAIRDQNHLGFGINFTQKTSFLNNPSLFSGFEFQLNHFGSDSWNTGQSVQFNQLNVLYALHYFVIPHIELQAKAGVGWQYNQSNNMGSNVNWFALPVVGVSANVYVASKVSVGMSWQYTFGSGDGQALQNNHKTIAHSNYALNLSYHF